MELIFLNSLKVLMLVKKLGSAFLSKVPYLLLLCRELLWRRERRFIILFYTSVKTLHVIASSILFLVWHTVPAPELLCTLRMLELDKDQNSCIELF